MELITMIFLFFCFVLLVKIRDTLDCLLAVLKISIRICTNEAEKKEEKDNN